MYFLHDACHRFDLQCYKLGTLATDSGSEMPIHTAHVTSKKLILTTMMSVVLCQKQNFPNSIEKRTSDAMTQTRLRQMNWNGG